MSQSFRLLTSLTYDNIKILNINMTQVRIYYQFFTLKFYDEHFIVYHQNRTDEEDFNVTVLTYNYDLDIINSKIYGKSYDGYIDELKTEDVYSINSFTNLPECVVKVNCTEFTKSYVNKPSILQINKKHMIIIDQNDREMRLVLIKNN